VRLVCFGDVHMAGAVTRLAGEIDTADAAIRVGHLTDWAGREDEASDACVQVAEQQPGPCGRQTRDRGQARRSAMLATRTLLAVALAIAIPLAPALAENPVAPAPDAPAAAQTPDTTGTSLSGPAAR
jgi:hypothetical protein